MSKKIKKAVIPAAGLGTRFLPATKTIPKELLPIVDRPSLLYIVEECVHAGIEDIVLISGRGKSAIEDFFDTSYELEAVLEKSGKQELLETIRPLKDMANIISIRQKEALGLGHAVFTAAPVVGNEPFAVLLGDEIMVNAQGKGEGVSQLCERYTKLQQSVVAMMEVSPSDVHKYGIVDGKMEKENLFRVTNVIEKPSAEAAPTRWALPGRYVFDAKIFEYLKETPPGKNGEIQLTDGMCRLADDSGLWATQLTARRFDAGDKLGYLQANIELGLLHPQVGSQLKQYLKDLCKDL